jgi:RNA polymerase sigma-70 factor (ECF subfamily)
MYDDKDLVRRTLDGDKEAFEMIVRRYKQPLLNYIGRMVSERELALDFTQDVFIKTYASLHTYRPQHKFSTWLFKIASNLTIDYWRKKKIEAYSFDQTRDDADDRPSIQIPSKDLSVMEKFELTEIREKVEHAMQKIPPSLRELFVWRHINEFSYEEIAEIRGLPIGTIKNKVFQAKELIRWHVEESA